MKKEGVSRRISKLCKKLKFKKVEIEYENFGMKSKKNPFSEHKFLFSRPHLPPQTPIKQRFIITHTLCNIDIFAYKKKFKENKQKRLEEIVMSF